MSELDPSQRMVITGMGCVTALGNDVESSWNALINSKHGIKNIRTGRLSGYDESRVRASLGAPVEDFDLLSNPIFNTPEVRKDMKKWHQSAQFVLEAGFQALSQAGLLAEEGLRVDSSKVSSEGFGVSIGTGIGGAIDALGESQRIIDNPEGSRVRPTAILHALPNRPNEVASIVFGAEAFADSSFGECATGVANIRRAIQEIKDGEAEIVLAGGVETGVTPLSLALFGATGAVNLSQDVATASRPFNRDPGGLVAGEGAGIVVVETLESARRRGATVLAEVVGYGKSADAYKDTAPSGRGAVRAVTRALARARLSAEEIENAYINAHATSTDGDAIEMWAISQVFRPEQAYVSSTKGATGHPFGAAGGVETAFCVKALETGVVPPSLKLEDPVDEAVGWRMSPHEATQTDGIEFAVNQSFGFGGINEAIILKRP